MVASYLPTVRYYRSSKASALALPVTAGLYGAMTIDSARRHYRGVIAWKGRLTATEGANTGGGRQCPRT
jgi:hypothetical protein